MHLLIERTGYVTVKEKSGSPGCLDDFEKELSILLFQNNLTAM